MDDAILRTYLDCWSDITNSTPASVEAMIACAHPEIRFCDVNSTNLHVGHQGIRHICELASQGYPDARIVWRDLLFDGRKWSIRWTLSGSQPDGTTFSCEGASAGRLAYDGRIIEHTDYWNRSSIHP